MGAFAAGLKAGVGGVVPAAVFAGGTVPLEAASGAGAAKRLPPGPCCVTGIAGGVVTGTCSPAYAEFKREGVGAAANAESNALPVRPAY